MHPPGIARCSRKLQVQARAVRSVAFRGASATLRKEAMSPRGMPGMMQGIFAFVG